MDMTTTTPASETREFDFGDRDFKRVCDLIYQRVGIALAPAKRDMVYGRLSRRLRVLGLRSFRDYLDQLETGNDEEEWQAFTNALTTNLTSFFREPHHFDKLREELQQRASQAPLKIWSCAASTGEEPYSIAITACEAFGTLTPPVSIVATDVDTQVLETASRGIYAIDRVASLDASIKRKYFQRGSGPNEGKCRVIPELRQLIEYRQLNLLASRYDVGGPYAALFCRNVMIYFDKPTQRGILSRLVSHMGDDGLLYTGHSENYLHAADLIQPCGRTLYRRAPRAGVSA
ncbi:CheR family methyltransferase [Xanthomonas oryzae pv. oryzicola]|uniref:Chemotaxis protein methyltransferase n=1 Tax=Xanthomonas oryzae pv. oryzicola (strain BLS256) TaxID=383407 RepID=G7TEQ2_XANOB|nr:CheR family methyltransferase [Xanthomonas oryzae]AEQ96417.1 chemotaxis protein methyltransferase 2 [Xanthomonas oryzae pv. oryzicola BLS256]AJQ87522.1 chemotaxis protein CheR [Xanthomonas oryzae pv. oryzicola]AKN93470.1 chemotaxis protein CheR [Xanthomonas oryzae pv. oryzicola]AKN97200.1 chemotaxis protein CheR [Xanthomonas oryzae pv. oryzicola]AKO04688.1 chemotaxis protein CheR [Xanthomonas oryzae pv. oryzicola]